MKTIFIMLAALATHCNSCDTVTSVSRDLPTAGLASGGTGVIGASTGGTKKLDHHDTPPNGGSHGNGGQSGKRLDWHAGTETANGCVTVIPS